MRAKDDRMVLLGVSIVEKGTANAAATDVNGRYTLVTTHPKPRLFASSIGYATKEWVRTAEGE